MSLPKVQNAIFEIKSITDASNSRSQYNDKHIKMLAVIQKDNPGLYKYLMGAASAELQNPDDNILIEMFIRGAVSMYDLLNSQAEADDLQAQWGDNDVTSG